MSNKREFKKYISEVSSSVCGYMMEVCAYVPEANEEEINKAVICVLTAAEAAILKSNIKFDKTPKAFPEGGYKKARKAFYNALFCKASKEFKDAIDAALKMFNAAVPEEVKEQNKKLLQD